MPCRSINDEAELYKSKKFKADSAWLIVFKANDSFVIIQYEPGKIPVSNQEIEEIIFSEWDFDQFSFM